MHGLNETMEGKKNNMFFADDFCIRQQFLHVDKSNKCKHKCQNW